MAGTASEEANNAAQLPPLSAAEFRQFNSMADHMEYFHNNFRRTWTALYAECNGGKKMGPPQFTATGLTFCHHLHMHHSIEEQHIFPVLAEKMPAFRKELELLSQHKQIHKGMEEFQAYLVDCSNGRRKKFDWDEIKAIMDSFGEVLWAHLDGMPFPRVAFRLMTFRRMNRRRRGFTLAHRPYCKKMMLSSKPTIDEVRQLGANNMRQYWTIAEVGVFLAFVAVSDS